MLPETRVDVAVIGGGPAGLAAAVAARRSGAERVLILERLNEAGGILPQCIHNGFGLHVFKEELTGPEYAGRFIAEAGEAGVSVQTGAMVLAVSPERVLTVMGPGGLSRVAAGSLVLAMGCRERTAPNILLSGARPAGVFTAGTAQRLMNIEGYLPGREVVVIGSGDIGLIMARRLTLAGAQVKAVVELLPYPGGLARNIRQCLEDFGIPLLLSHATLAVEGRNRVTGVWIAPIGPDGKPDQTAKRYIGCDTVLLSVGLIPENELSRQVGLEVDSRTGGPVVDERLETTVPGIFACGNVLHVHDLVDYVTAEAQAAGRNAARAAAGLTAGAVTDGDGRDPDSYLPLVPGRNVRYVLPQRLSTEARRDCGNGDTGVGKTEETLVLSSRVKLPGGAADIRLAGVRLGRVPVTRPSEMIRIEVPREKLLEAVRHGDHQRGLALDIEEVEA